MDRFLRLHDDFHLKILEKPCVYNRRTDELYELSPAAFRFLERCDGSSAAEEMQPREDFLRYCLDEGVLEILPRPRLREVRVGRNEIPSLRYLMVEITDRCNLRCLHCYLGEAGETELPPWKLERTVEDFERMGGLRFMVTGGEPLLHRRFDEINDLLHDRSFRSILITNGTVLEKERLDGLNFHEIQFSIDGLEEGHDLLRGRGTFRKAWENMVKSLEAGFDVSVATVIHRANLGELPRMADYLQSLGVKAWSLEFPVPAGRLLENRRLMPSLQEALPLLELEWGEGPHHEGSGEYACGAHMACLTPEGRLVKCGYYRDVAGGEIEVGLRGAWRALPKLGLEGICPRCEDLAACGGGCRFRAEAMRGPGGPDPVACARRGRITP